MSRKLKDVELVSDENSAEKALGLSCGGIIEESEEEIGSVAEIFPEIILPKSRSRQH
jgi:hypothetical protein